jgi:hypothetical protein
MHTSTTKTWSSPCAPRAGLLSFAFRTICLVVCIVTSAAITNTPHLLINKTTEILLLLLCNTKCLLVKYSYRAGQGN